MKSKGPKIAVLFIAYALAGCIGPAGNEQSKIPDHIEALFAERPSLDCDGAPYEDQPGLFNFKGTFMRDNGTGSYFRVEAVGKYLVNWSNVETYADGDGISVAFGDQPDFESVVRVPVGKNNSLNIAEAFGVGAIQQCQTLFYCRSSEASEGIRIAVVSPMWDETWGTQTHSNVWVDIPVC